MREIRKRTARRGALVGWGSPAEPSQFFQNSSDLIQQYEKLIYGYFQ
jgi:hypothetical protein